MSFLKFLGRHYGKIVIAAIAIASITIAGVTVLKSKQEYDAYLVEYEKNANEIKAGFPALPESVLIDNSYVTYSGDEVASTKSAYTKSLVYFARDARITMLSELKPYHFKTLNDVEAEDAKYTLDEYITDLDMMGGTMTFTITTEHYGNSDIEIVMRNNWHNTAGEYQTIDNITDKISIQVNKLDLKTTNVSLSNSREGFQSLILKDTFLLKGDNTITLGTSAYNDTDSKDNCLYIFPDIRNLTVLTDVDLVAPDRAADEVEEA